MNSDNSLQALKQISANVSEQEKLIWENEAHHIVYTEATKKLQDEIKRIIEYLEKTEAEDEMLQIQIQQLDCLISIQKESLGTEETSLINMKLLQKRLIEEIEEFGSDYQTVLQNYDEEYKQHRSRYETTSDSYQELRAKRIELKMFKFKQMVLDSQIISNNRIQKQYDEIQLLRGQKIVCNFAEIFFCYKTKDESRILLEEKKCLEQQLLKDYLVVEESVKLKQRSNYNNKIQKRALNIHGTPNITKVEQKTSLQEKLVLSTQQSGTKLFSDKVQQFLTEDLPSSLFTSLESDNSPPSRPTQQNFNDTKSKCRILDCKIVKKPVIEKKDLRSELENVVRNAKNSWSGNNTPQLASSQEAQNLQPITLNRQIVKKPIAEKQDLRSELESIVRNTKNAWSRNDTPQLTSSQEVQNSQPITGEIKQTESQTMIIEEPRILNENLCNSNQMKIDASQETKNFKMNINPRLKRNEQNSNITSAPTTENVATSRFFAATHKTATFQNNQMNADVFSQPNSLLSNMFHKQPALQASFTSELNKPAATEILCNKQPATFSFYKGNELRMQSNRNVPHESSIFADPATDNKQEEFLKSSLASNESNAIENKFMSAPLYFNDNSPDMTLNESLNQDAFDASMMSPPTNQMEENESMMESSVQHKGIFSFGSQNNMFPF